MALVARSTGRRTNAWIRTDRTGVSDVIAQLEAAMVFGKSLTSGGDDPGAGTQYGRISQIKHPFWRIDRQRGIAGVGEAPGKSNLQVQPNGVNNEPSSVACLLIPHEYLYQIAGPGSANRDAELTRILRQGLVRSLESWIRQTQSGSGMRDATIEVFEVTGEFSSPRPEFVSPQKPVR
jgi:hypothetical protein